MAEPEPKPAQAAAGRVFLIVVDATAEMRSALRFACNRAKKTAGRVALLYVLEPADFQQWMAVESLIQEERREEAEKLLQDLSAQVNEIAGTMPMVYVREGERAAQIMKLIDEEPSISILVLGAGAGPEGPGPLVSYLVGKMAGKLRVPITVVPGKLTNEQIDALT
jgi:nucleotide-binding universal stress UspA family protein